MRRIGEPDEVVMARIMEATLAWSTFDLDEAEQMAADVRAEGIERGRPEYAAAGSWLLGQCALFREDGPLAVRRLDSCLSELAQSDASTRPFLPVITPSMQLVPVAGRLVPCIEETMLLGRRVGVSPSHRIRVVRDSGMRTGCLGTRSRRSPSSPTPSTSSPTSAMTWPRAQALHQSGCIHRDSGDYHEAAQALSLARDLRLRLGDRRGELLTEINVALLHAMAGDIDRGLGNARRCTVRVRVRRRPGGDGRDLDRTRCHRTHVRREPRGARDVSTRAAERFAPWRRLSGWLRLMVAELSNELADHRRAAREIAAAASVFDRTECLIAARRLAALRDRDAGEAAWAGTSR